MFKIFKFTVEMIKCFIGVPMAVGKVAGAAIGTTVTAAEVIKDSKKDSDAKKAGKDIL